MVEVGGRTILSRLIEEVERQTDRIHVVVGYREELIIQHCALHHRNVVLVRNPDFRTTQTIHSYRLGARGLPGPALFIDGDCLIAPGALGSFVEAARGHRSLVGLTPASSDHAVFAAVREGDRGTEVVGFDRATPEAQEWASVLITPADVLEGHENFVYEALAEHLPLPAATIELAEVDTTADLERAHVRAAQWWPAG
ncbi:NTP transferase domain-containing protein [Nocardioides euryhalodurans]|nr:NTP transferase domain-containing protein [Nocardioides euryhalodurans]